VRPLPSGRPIVRRPPGSGCAPEAKCRPSVDYIRQHTSGQVVQPLASRPSCRDSHVLHVLRGPTCEGGAGQREVQHGAVLLHVAPLQQPAQVLLQGARVKGGPLPFQPQDAAPPQHIADARPVRRLRRLLRVLS
jgi:hypothetical protein